MFYPIDNSDIQDDVFLCMSTLFQDYPELVEILNKQLVYENENGQKEFLESFRRINEKLLSGGIEISEEQQIIHDFYIAARNYIRGVEQYQTLYKTQEKEKNERNKDSEEAKNIIGTMELL